MELRAQKKGVVLMKMLVESYLVGVEDYWGWDREEHNLKKGDGIQEEGCLKLRFWRY